MMLRLLNIALLGCTLFLMNSSPVFAQPGRGDNQDGRGGFRGRGGPPGGGFQRGGEFQRGSGAPRWGGRGRGGPPGGDSQDSRGSWGGRGGFAGNGGFDPVQMLSRMDRNGDGQLSPEEVPDRVKQFLAPRLQQQGIDISKPIDLNAMREKMNGNKESNDNRSNPAASEEAPLVPEFGEPFDLAPPPGFDLPEDSPLLDPRPIEKRYDEGVVRQVEETLRRYDRNRNDVLEAEEIARGRFYSPAPSESDLDGDGNLTKVELAERYVARNEQRGGDRGRGRGNDDNDNRNRWREQRGSDQGQNGRSWGNRGEDERQDRDNGSDQRRGDKSSTTGRTRTGDQSREARIKRYAQSLLDRYDRDKDGKLSKEEAGNIRGGAMENADANGDGQIELDEMVKRFGGGGSNEGSKSKSNSDRPTSGASGTSNGGATKRFTTIQERLENLDVGSDFIDNDKNSDGQLQMVEYITDWVADSDSLQEFRRRDENGDGVITSQEWINTSGGSQGLSKGRSSPGGYDRASRERDDKDEHDDH